MIRIIVDKLQQLSICYITYTIRYLRRFGLKATPALLFTFLEKFPEKFVFFTRKKNQKAKNKISR